MTAPSRRSVLGTAGAIGLGAAAGFPVTAHAAEGPAFDTAPARSALNRLLPGHADQFSLGLLSPQGGDRFRVTGTRGQDRGVRYDTGRAAHGSSLVSQVRLRSAHRVERQPARPAEDAAGAPAPAGEIHRAPPPVRAQRHERRLHRAVRRLAVLGADDRRPRAARLQRGPRHRGHGGRVRARPEGLRVQRRGVARLAAGAHAPAVVAPAEPVGVRRTALARTHREARGAGPEDHRQAARARHVARVPRLLRACPPRLRGTQRRRRARRAAGHLARLRPARLARPAHPVLRRRGRLVLRASAGPVRRGRALQDGPAARGRHRR